jgi:hypothetical protein
MSETRKLAAIRSQISLAIAGLVARLEGIAKLGAIYLSEDAYRQVKQRLDLKVADFGAVQLKNIADGPRLFARSRQAGRTELAPTFAAIGTAVTAARSRKGRSRTLLPSALPAASVAVLSAVGWFVGGTRAAARIGPAPIATTADKELAHAPRLSTVVRRGQAVRLHEHYPARCGSGMPANASRSRAGQRRHLLPYLLRTANGRILRLIF